MKRVTPIILVWLSLAGVASADRYWVGGVPWVAAAGNIPAHYEAPAGVTSWIDLRTSSECGTAGTAASGVAIFVTADATNLGANYTGLGTDPERVLTGPQKAALVTTLRLQSAPTSNVLADILYESLTSLADPAGASRCKPIVPTNSLRYEVWLAGKKIRDKAFDSNGPEATVLQTQLRAEYRAIRQDCIDGKLPATLYKKWCGYNVRKLQVAYRWLQPPDLPDEPDLPPSTTITESFNKADSGTLGPDLTWTEVAGAWEVFSNQCRDNELVGSFMAARAETDLSSTDHYAQLSIIAIGTGTDTVGGGPAVRFSASAQTYYCALVYRGDSKVYLSKIVAGTNTYLANTAITISVPETWKIEANGSALKIFQAGTQRISITDTSITTGTRCGIDAFPSAANKFTVDDFQAADLSAGSAGKTWPYYYKQSALKHDRNWASLFDPHFALVP